VQFVRLLQVQQKKIYRTTGIAAEAKKQGAEAYEETEKEIE
jgi:hypothetical protein